MIKNPEKLLIPIANAIEHYGRPGDGHGGRAELTRRCGVTSQALSRWAGPYIPAHHVKTLFKKDHTIAKLAINHDEVNT